ncbi:MAG: hypothetical protein AAGD13_24990 [Pseudomonadota bacterium]
MTGCNEAGRERETNTVGGFDASDMNGMRKAAPDRYRSEIIGRGRRDNRLHPARPATFESWQQAVVLDGLF